MGRKMAHPSVRLASGPQLWRLNALGLIRLVGGPADAVTGKMASDELARQLREQGLAAFPRRGDGPVVETVSSTS